MHVDRDRFLLAAVTLFAGCERADAVVPEVVPSAPLATVEVQRPAVSAVAREMAPPAPRPISPRQWFHSLTERQQLNVLAVCEWQACRQVLRAVAGMQAAETRLLVGVSETHARAYCRAMPAPTCETPLVVAFDGQPVEFAPAGDAAFAFVPGAPLRSDWPTAATPWIARDLDGDGAITSGAELFGSATAVGDGVARNGFAALAALDANRDGVVDARDPAFAELVLWSDRDGDHRSRPDELRPLASVVTQIPLAHALDPRCTARGACEGERGTLRWRDATGTEREGVVVDVYVPAAP